VLRLSGLRLSGLLPSRGRSVAKGKNALTASVFKRNFPAAPQALDGLYQAIAAQELKVALIGIRHFELLRKNDRDLRIGKKARGKYRRKRDCTSAVYCGDRLLARDAAENAIVAKTSTSLYEPYGSVLTSEPEAERHSSVVAAGFGYAAKIPLVECCPRIAASKKLICKLAAVDGLRAKSSIKDVGSV
jgi:hypothetical protein